MRKLQYWLVALILIQFVIAAGMFWHTQQKTQNYLANKPLFNFESQDIDSVKIEDGTDTLTLVKSDGTWFLPELHNLPADAEKINSILTKIHQIKTTWPVATSNTGQTRFEVAENKFQRRIQLHQETKVVADLYVGTSVGLRTYHVRKAKDDATMTADITNYELDTQERPWLDRAILSAKDIEAIEGQDYALQQVNGQWRFSQNNPLLSENMQLDTEKAVNLAQVLEHLHVQNVISQSLATAPQPDIRLTVTDAVGNWDYEFRAMNGDYFVSRNDWDLLFQISKPDFDHIEKIGFTELALPVEPEHLDDETLNTEEQLASSQETLDDLETP